MCALLVGLWVRERWERDERSAREYWKECGLEEGRKKGLKLGRKEESNKLYYKALENTRNGLIWQKVEDETGISRIEIERSLIEES